MSEPRQQWVRCEDGTLVNLAQSDAILVRRSRTESQVNSSIVCYFGADEYILARFEDYDDADEALDILERQLPFAIISMDLDVRARMGARTIKAESEVAP